MKPSILPRAFLLGCGVLFAAPSLRAAQLYWTGGAGTWDLSNTSWATASSGPWTTKWTNTSNTAVFGGTAGTVTLGDDISVGGLQFDTTGYIIDAATNSKNLTLGATNNTIYLNNVAAATITGTVVGSGNLILSSSNRATAGTLTLNNTGSGWSGTTTVNAGTTLWIGQTSQALANTSSIAINGGTIRIDRVNDAIAGTQIADGAGITFTGGGSLVFRHNTAILSKTENIGAVTVASGQANFELNNGSSSAGNSIVLSSLTRSINTATATFASRGSTNVLFKVTGAADTAAGGIIGPWATFGDNTAAQTDYAIYSGGNGTLAGRAIAATAENTWAGGSNVTLSGGSTLTGNRTLNTLRATGAAQTLALGSNNLETYGLLQGGSGLLTVSGTGALTTPSGGGNLFATAGSNSITVSAPINDNSGAVTLVKSGGGTLTLSSTTSNYSGGTVLNSGTLATTADSNLGSSGGVVFNGSATWNLGLASPVTYNRSLTINEGAVATFSSGNAAKTISGVVSGNGALVWSVTTDLVLSNTANTFNGPITVTTGGTNPYGFSPSSLGDDPGAGLISLGGTSGTGYFWWNGGAKTFSNRQFALSGTTGGGYLANNGSGALVINKDLLVTGIGNKSLTLAGSNTGSNIFSGNITDGTGSVVGLQKSGTGTWILTGNNTYTGNTKLNTGTGPLIFQGTQSAPSGGTITLNQISSNTSAVRLLADDSTNTFATTVAFDQRNSSTGLGFMVGNTGSGNGGTGGGTTTGATTFVNKFAFIANQGAVGGLDGPATIDIRNDYTLSVGDISFAAVANVGANWKCMLAPNGTMLVTGTVQQDNGNTSTGKNVVFNLDGTSNGNIISGNIKDAADFTSGSNANARELTLTKTNSSTWTLSGTGSNYTGSTTISGGTLAGIGANAFGSTSGISIAGAGTLSLLGDSNTSFVKASDNSPYTITTSATGTTINVDQATIAGTGTKTMTIGALGTTSTAATYQVNFTGANNTSLSLGAMTGAASTAAGTVAINNSITGGGNLTLASYTSANTSGGETITFSGTGNSIVTGAVTPGATTLNLRQNGSGTLTLNGSSSYAGITTISEGVLEAGVLANGGSNSSIGASGNAASNLVFGAPDATFRYIGSSDVAIDRGFTTSSAAGGGATIESSGTGTLSFDNTVAINYGTNNQTRSLALGGINAGANTFGKVIADNGSGATSLVKAGSGTWVLDQTNSYTGSTNVNGGKLAISGSGSINSTGSISISAGATFAYNSSTALTVAPTLNGTGPGTGQRAVLGGSGPINTAVTLNNTGDVLSPGNSPGIMSFGADQTWASFSYDWELNDWANDVAGTNIDQIGITGSLTLSGGAAGSYLLNVLSLTGGNVSGDAPNFAETSRSWTILSTTGGISGFDSSHWNVVTSGFSNHETGDWSLAQSGNNLVLTYTPVPEPRTALLGILSTLILLRRRRLNPAATNPRVQETADRPVKPRSA